MTKMQCKVCKCIITEDIDRVKDVKAIQCPVCGRIFENPYYEEIR
jgi:rubredoxin